MIPTLVGAMIVGAVLIAYNNREDFFWKIIGVSLLVLICYLVGVLALVVLGGGW